MGSLLKYIFFSRRFDGLSRPKFLTWKLEKRGKMHFSPSTSYAPSRFCCTTHEQNWWNWTHTMLAGNIVLLLSCKWIPGYLQSSSFYHSISILKFWFFSFCGSTLFPVVSHLPSCLHALMDSLILYLLCLGKPPSPGYLGTYPLYIL